MCMGYALETGRLVKFLIEKTTVPSASESQREEGADASSASELDCGHSSLSPSHALLFCPSPSQSWAARGYNNDGRNTL